MTLPVLNNTEAQVLLDLGALLVDVREESEHERSRIPGSLNAPLSVLPRRIGGEGVEAVIYYCDVDCVTHENAARLARVAQAPAYALEGGLRAWRKVGLPVERGTRVLPSVPQQVMLVLFVVLAVDALLTIVVHPGFMVVALGVALGLAVAAVRGRCAMAALLRRMPWNRAAKAARDYSAA